MTKSLIIEKDKKRRRHTPEQIAMLKKHAIKPGEVRNPKGRGKGAVSMIMLLRKVIEEEIEGVDPLDGVLNRTHNPRTGEPYNEKTLERQKRLKLSIKEFINRALLANAMRGEMAAIESVFRKVDDLPDQNIKVTNGTPDVKADEDIMKLIEDGTE